MLKKKTLIWAVVVLLGLCVIVAYMRPSCEKRECYFELDSPLRDEVYAKPDDLVERFFSDPDAYSRGGHKVDVSETNDGVTIIIEMYGVPDDSIQDIRYRFDLHEKNGLWEVEWSGLQQRCGRGAIGPQSWHNHYCN